MRRFTIVILAIGLLLPSVSCFRATYTNLYGKESPVPVLAPAAADRAGSRWQHFFLFGWVPGMRVIPSADLCGSRRVSEIRTRQTFLQGLVYQLTTVYVNIYMPWNGETICER